MILAFDIGNSNVTIGLSENNFWKDVWRLPTSTQSDALLFYETRLVNLLFEAQIPEEAIQQVVISSVVPDLRPLFQELTIHLFSIEPIVVAPEIYHYFQLQIDNPTEIGTDLLANAVAAHHLLKQPCIIVDFGTALTFTTIDKKGKILGVAITPGLKTAISALFQKTAQLPEVPLELPNSALGKNTVHAIQSGILIGYVGLVRHVLDHIRSEVGAHYQAIATGGLSAILHPLHDTFDQVDPHLTLNGLIKIGELVKNKKKAH